MILRIYYVFNLKKEVYDVYKDTPSVLYNFLFELYHFNKENLDYGNTLFKQVANSFNKEAIDLKIYLKLHNKMRYSKRGEEHIINNLYKDEIGIMKVKKSYIIINCNKRNSEFFNIICDDYKESFACDFVNQDYFFLSKIRNEVVKLIK